MVHDFQRAQISASNEQQNFDTIAVSFNGNGLAHTGLRRRFRAAEIYRAAATIALAYHLNLCRLA